MWRTDNIFTCPCFVRPCECVPVLALSTISRSPPTTTAACLCFSSPTLPSLSLSISRSSHFLYCHPHKVWRLKKIINFEEIFHQKLERYKCDLSVTTVVCCLRAVLTFDALLSFSLHCLLLLDICFINLSRRRLSFIITVKSIEPFCTQLKEITSSSTHNFNLTLNNYKWHI